MYDTIIIGRDLSSWVAALASCKQGFKTLLVSEETTMVERQEGGYRFSIEPEPFSGLCPDQTVFRLLNELHPEPEASPQLIALNPAFQVILPGQRVDFFSDPQRLLAELIREYPQESHEIHRFYRAVGKAAVLAERWVEEDLHGEPGKLACFLRKLRRLPKVTALHASLAVKTPPFSLSLRELVAAQLTFLSHLDQCPARLPVSAAYLLTLPVRGMSYPLGGRDAWISWIRRGFIKAGGTLIDDGSIMRLEMQPEVIVDLERSGSPFSVRSRRLIISVQWEKLGLLLLQQRGLGRLARRLASVGARAYPFTLQMGVQEKGLPERMAPYVVVIPDEKDKLRAHGPVSLRASLPEETGRAPAGRRAIGATVFLKESPLTLSDEQLRDAAKSIMDVLEVFLPFLRDSIDYLDIEKSIAQARHCHEVISPHYRLPPLSWMALNLLTPATPLANVFLTGSALRAGLGFEGEVLAGLDAALWAGKKEHGNG